MKKSRISALKQRKLVEFFVTEVTARNAAKILGVNPKTAAYFYLRLRKIIFEYTTQERTHVLGGKIELDESYFGGKRKGKKDSPYMTLWKSFIEKRTILSNDQHVYDKRDKK